MQHTRLKFFFLVPSSARLWFYFYFCKNTNKHSLCTSRFSDTFPHISSTSILLLNLWHNKASDSPLFFDPCISYPSYHSEIFFVQPCALNRELLEWCKVAPDCCCSHCHVCRLPCCSERHPSSKRHWKTGKQSERRFMILLVRRKRCREGVVWD